MYSIEKMVQEHQVILKVCRSMHQACVQIVAGQPLATDDFRAAIRFIRGYADAYHHGKEEHFLFNEMTVHLGPVAEKLIKHGMLSDHAMARYQILKLEEALTAYEQGPSAESKLLILAHMMAYIDLLQGHIVREDTAVYPFAEKNLDPQILQAIDEKTAAFEADPAQRAVADELVGVANALAEKYLS